VGREDGRVNPPKLLEIKKKSPVEISFRWDDGTERFYSPAFLRRLCPCAHCVNELTGVRQLRPETIPDSLTVDKIFPVGRYALQFQWSDQHDTGIYPFTYLWSLKEGQV